MLIKKLSRVSFRCPLLSSACEKIDLLSVSIMLMNLQQKLEQNI